MATKYNVKKKTANLPTTELVVLFWSKGKLGLTGKDKNFVQKYLERFSAKGEAHEKLVVPYPHKERPRYVFLVGLGQNPAIDVYRRGVAAAAQYAKQIAVRDLVIIFPEEIGNMFEIAKASVEGVELGTYVFSKYQAETAKAERTKSIRNVDLYFSDVSSEISRGIKEGRIFTEATKYVRELVNEPADKIKPVGLVEQAKVIAENSNGSVTVEIFDKKECEARNMDAFLAVARGSDHDPYFIHLIYKPLTQNSQITAAPVAIVGKGITFDSGGLSIKPADYMETMKEDMAGAAAVLGTFLVLDKIRPNFEVHGYIAACENMPSGSAIKPGDIVTSQSGKTIEVRNTDAEGRLTLADAISEALKIKPRAIIDLATLTGACVVALGEEVAGLFSNNSFLKDAVMKAADKEGERMWELPLVPEYRDVIKSSVADIRNTSLRKGAGAITAALFLQEFVDGKPWVHIDIAGPAFTESQINPVYPIGASGYGTRTILQYLQDLKGEVTPHPSESNS